MAIGFLFAFIWNVKSGQYQDIVTPSIRILFEEQNKNENQNSNNNNSNKSKE